MARRSKMEGVSAARFRSCTPTSTRYYIPPKSRFISPLCARSNRPPSKKFRPLHISKQEESYARSISRPAHHITCTKNAKHSTVLFTTSSSKQPVSPYLSSPPQFWPTYPAAPVASCAQLGKARQRATRRALWSS